MSTFLFFADWFFRAQAIIVAVFGLAMLLLLILASVCDGVSRLKARKGERP